MPEQPRSRRWSPLSPLAALLVIAALLALPPSRAGAASHLWQIWEIFSSPDGSVQFIELHECCGAADETDIEGLWISSFTVIHTFFFPADLPPGSTANRHLLLATAAFAALPGAPAPDHIIEENFFSPSHDVLGYYFFPAAELAFGPGELPTDGVQSLRRDGQVEPNSPTNFAGETGSVVAPCEFLRGDANADGVANIADAVAILAFLFTGGAPALPPAAADVNADAATDLADPISLLAFLFSGGPAPPAPFPEAACE